MKTIDIILLIPVLFGLARGLWSGFINQIAGIVGVACGILLGYLFNEDAVAFLVDQFDMTTESANVVGFIALFLGAFLIVQLVAKMLTKGVKMAALGPVNRLLGGVFGAVKYGIFTILVLTVFNRVNDAMNLIEKEKLEESRVYSTYSELSLLLWEYVPEDDFELDLESIQDRLDPR